MDRDPNQVRVVCRRLLRAMLCRWPLAFEGLNEQTIIKLDTSDTTIGQHVEVQNAKPFVNQCDSFAKSPGRSRLFGTGRVDEANVTGVGPCAGSAATEFIGQPRQVRSSFTSQFAYPGWIERHCGHRGPAIVVDAFQKTTPATAGANVDPRRYTWLAIIGDVRFTNRDIEIGV